MTTTSASRWANMCAISEPAVAAPTTATTCREVGVSVISIIVARPIRGAASIAASFATLALACTLAQRDESALVREPFFYHKRRTITEETSVERKKNRCLRNGSSHVFLMWQWLKLVTAGCGSGSWAL